MVYFDIFIVTITILIRANKAMKTIYDCARCVICCIRMRKVLDITHFYSHVDPWFFSTPISVDKCN